MEVLIGNKRAKETLHSLIEQERLPHALGLEGPKGCGKRTLAGFVAQAAVCSAPQQQRPCGVCSHCKKAKASIHPDVISMAGKGGKNSFQIKAIREMRAEAQMSPNEAAVKVFILEDAHQMTIQAQNALLKVMEEPPADVCFILTYTGRNTLLPTICSRMVSISLEPPTIQECTQYLLETQPQELHDQCERVAQLADGNIGQAQELLQDEKALGKAEDPSKLIQAIARGEGFTALVLLAAYEKNRDDYLTLLQETGHFVRLQASAPFRGRNSDITALQAVVLADIIEDAKAQATQNVGLNLVSARLCAAAINNI